MLIYNNIPHTKGKQTQECSETDIPQHLPLKACECEPASARLRFPFESVKQQF